MKNIMKDNVLSLLLELSLCKSHEDANQWYENTRLPSCGDKTAEELVAGRLGELLIDYIKHIADGGYE